MNNYFARPHKKDRCSDKSDYHFNHEDELLLVLNSLWLHLCICMYVYMHAYEP